MSPTSSFSENCLITKACPSVHIKFEYANEDDDNIKIVNLKGDEIKNNIKSVNDVSDKNTNIISSDKSSTNVTNDEEAINITSEKGTINITSGGEASVISENGILRAPLMEEISPKIGDIIAFKVRTLSRKLVPHVGNFNLIISSANNYKKKTSHLR